MPCVHANLLQSCRTLFDPTHHKPQGPLFMGILQTRILEWVALLSSKGSSWPRDQTHISYLLHWQAGFLPTELSGKGRKWSRSVFPTLCDRMDCSLPGSSVHGIFQARILEWVAISFSRRSSPPRGWTRVSRLVGRWFTVWATREALIIDYVCALETGILLYHHNRMIEVRILTIVLSLK